ncbi:secretin receptor-like [Galendromus occidentalis]|uniref:Secretin receptor-like n=1 Tax=Galendromus occidentalis TaxID=34638 RepID=A0AAJ7SFX0_9ACAR|nr:secretin receptor-like [Galendromus occidentalis]
MFKRHLFDRMRECETLRELELAQNTAVGNTDDWCPRVWDGLLCWEPMKSGVSSQKCPDLLNNLDTTQDVIRLCVPNGQNSHGTSPNASYSDFSRCFASKQRQLSLIKLYQTHIPLVKVISRLGYSTSFLLLLSALIILSSFRRLRCARNKLHCQLFLSYIFRAVIILAKDYFFISGVGFRKELQANQECIWCKTFLVLLQYTLLANHSWILAEGIYLHRLVFRAIHSSSCKASLSSRAVIAAWMSPLLFVIPWALLRYFLENRLCWTTNESIYILLVLQVPMSIAILLNFCLFLGITFTLWRRVRRPEIQPQNRRHTYREWFRASLILIPLLASHYLVLLAMSLLANFLSPRVEIVWFYVDQLFTSFQGCVVSFLYCFGNPEVLRQLKRRPTTYQSSRSSKLKSSTSRTLPRKHNETEATNSSPRWSLSLRNKICKQSEV